MFSSVMENVPSPVHTKVALNCITPFRNATPWKVTGPDTLALKWMSNARATVEAGPAA